MYQILLVQLSSTSNIQRKIRWDCFFIIQVVTISNFQVLVLIIFLKDNENSSLLPLLVEENMYIVHKYRVSSKILALCSLSPANPTPPLPSSPQKNRLAGRISQRQPNMNLRTCILLCFRWSSILSNWSAGKMILRSVVYLGQIGVRVRTLVTW